MPDPSKETMTSPSLWSRLSAWLHSVSSAVSGETADSVVQPEPQYCEDCAHCSLFGKSGEYLPRTRLTYAVCLAHPKKADSSHFLSREYAGLAYKFRYCDFARAQYANPAYCPKYELAALSDSKEPGEGPKKA